MSLNVITYGAAKSAIKKEISNNKEIQKSIDEYLKNNITVLDGYMDNKIGELKDELSYDVATEDDIDSLFP